MPIGGNVVGPAGESPPRITVLPWQATVTLDLAVLDLTFYEKVRMC